MPPRACRPAARRQPQPRRAGSAGRARVDRSHRPVCAPGAVKVAAFDVGTNTTRLLVAEGPEGTGGANGIPRELDRRLLFTRLGQDVDHTRRLRPEAIARTVAALRELHGVAAGLGAERFRLGATSAVRDAVNRDAFIEAARAAIGVEPEVLSGEDEARLSYL